MQQLGHTRSSHQPDHLLHTPDAFVRAPLPAMTNATAIVHISPAQGAAFMEYTAELQAGGTLGPVGEQRFVYVVDGELECGDHRLSANSYIYLPPGSDLRIRARGAARAIVIEKPYVELAGVEPPAQL